MSRITLAPNAAGTGTLTVAAPNTNTDRTLTLPDATTTLVGTDATQTLSNKTFSGTTTVPIIASGTSATDLALSAGTTFQTTGASIALRGSTAGYNTYGMEFYTGGTERMRIDASGNVGIGTSSPNFILQAALPNTTSNRQIGVTETVYTANFRATYLDLYGASATGTTYGVSNANLGALKFQNTSAGLIGTNDGVPLVFATTSVERMRIDATGNVSITQAAGKYTIDTTGGATGVANGGTVDFPSASGMLIVNNHSIGSVTTYLCGGGATAVIGNVGTQVGTFAYVAGINGYRWTNNSGSAAVFGFFFVRTRNNA